jgi:hypothetical protein
MTITVEQAEAQLRVDRENLASLLNQLADLDRRTVLAVDEREQISYQALVDGDAAAKCRLNQIHTEAARQQSEAASINAAVEEATRRVNEAECELGRATTAANAEKVRGLLAPLHLHAKHIDEALQAVVDGVTPPNERRTFLQLADACSQIALAGRRATAHRPMRHRHINR